MNASSDRVEKIAALKKAILDIEDQIDAIDDRLDQGPPPAEEAELKAKRNSLVAERAQLQAKLNDLLAGGGAITPPD